MTVFIERFVSLSNDEFIFHIRCHITNLVGYFSVFLINLAERSFNKSIFIYASIGGEGRNKTDVWSFRRFNRTHTSIVAVVDVANLESGAFSRQTSRTERGKPSLMSKLRKRIVLIHKLRKRRRTEKFLNYGIYRAAVDKGGRSHLVNFIDAHFLPYAFFKTGEAYSELILKQFADRTDSSVSEMIYIVERADSICDAIEVVDCGKNIVTGNMLGNKLIFAFNNSFFYFIVGFACVENILQNNNAYFFFYSAFFFNVKINVFTNVNHTVGNNLNFLFVLKLNKSNACAAIVDHVGFCLVDNISGFRNDLSCKEINNRLGNSVSYQSEAQTELLIVFMTSHS